MSRGQASLSQNVKFFLFPKPKAVLSNTDTRESSQPPMKQIKLSGRERSVLRYVDWSVGTKGSELLEATKIQPEDLVDVLNGLMSVGYMEMVPYAEATDVKTFHEKMFEVNPSYALELKSAMQRL
jgi:hypothetical protein